MCNTARSFAHESNACVISRWAFLILGFIDLLSCAPPPATLLSTIFGRGAGSRLRAPPSVCDNTPPDFVRNNPEMLSAFSTVLSEQKRDRKRFIIRQPPIGEKDDYDSKNSWNERLQSENFSIYGLVC